MIPPGYQFGPAVGPAGIIGLVFYRDNITSRGEKMSFCEFISPPPEKDVKPPEILYRKFSHFYVQTACQSMGGRVVNVILNFYIICKTSSF